MNGFSTGAVELQFMGPSIKRQEAVAQLKSSGFVEVSETVPWRECFPYSDELLPGKCLADTMSKESLTQKQLAALAGISQRHISEMENGKSSISHF